MQNQIKQTVQTILSGWQKIYSNDPYKMLEMRNITLTEDKKRQVLGGEVAMWTEQVKRIQQLE